MFRRKQHAEASFLPVVVYGRLAERGELVIPEIGSHDEGSCMLVFEDGKKVSAEYFLSWNENRHCWDLNLKPAENVLDRYPSKFVCQAKAYSFNASSLDEYNEAHFDGFVLPMTAQQFYDDYPPKGD